MNLHTTLKAADLVAELISSVPVRERILRDPVGRWAGLSPSMRTQIYQWRAPGLLEQLTDASVPSVETFRDDVRRGQAGSRPPATEALELRDTIEAGAVELHAVLRTSAGRTPARRSAVDALREIPELMTHGEPGAARMALSALHAWVRMARTALTYDVPVVELRDVACPYCDGSLRVRADASSDVWCADRECLDTDGNRHTWPRGRWLFLLDTG